MHPVAVLDDSTASNNGSADRSHQTRKFARMVGLEPKKTAVRSPENFVKTMKRDYISSCRNQTG
jgi:transposase InsO family protein